MSKSVPPAAPTPKPSIYQPDNAGLRNYIVNLPKSSRYKYSRDFRWVEDELAKIRSVNPRATYEEWLKTKMA